MEKKHTVQRISNKKRVKPKVRFSFMMLIIITFLTFLVCFILYMINANVKGDLLDDDDDDKSAVTTAITTEALTDEEGNTLSSEDSTAENNVSETQAAASSGTITYPLAQSAAVDSSYFDNCCIITDTILLSISKYTDFEDVVGNSLLNAKNCNETTISSSYGNITAYQTMQLKKPENIYIMLGSDLGTNTVSDMIASYTTLVTSLHNYLPDTHIYVMQVPPAPAESTTITSELVDEYNTKLMDMAKSVGVYCLDTNTALRSADGTISDNYWSDDDSTLTEEGYKKVESYILTHTI